MSDESDRPYNPLGNIEQETVDVFAFEIRDLREQRLGSLPEQVTISKYLDPDGRVFCRLAFIHQGGGIPGLLVLLRESASAATGLRLAQLEHGEKVKEAEEEIIRRASAHIDKIGEN